MEPFRQQQILFFTLLIWHETRTHLDVAQQQPVELSSHEVHAEDAVRRVVQSDVALDVKWVLVPQQWCDWEVSLLWH